MAFSAAGLTALVGGCGVFPKVNEPIELYTLTPKSSFPENLPVVNWQLVVETPTAPAGTDTARIALSRTPFTLEYFAKVGWTDRAPEMVQTLLIESFESTGKIVGVGMESIGLRADYLLKTDLREFQALYEEGNDIPTVLVRVSALLIRMPARRIQASLAPEARVKAAGPGFTDVIAAFDEALGAVLRDIVAFTLTEGQKGFS
ncbi:MAG: ABC-type transport auxiliary lipoprotein family protein [Rhodospirillaceae bacterium]|nr:ABC-type transport auxiliary lipoprotein family protein [Rhodospirillaceae bacterium]